MSRPVSLNDGRSLIVQYPPRRVEEKVQCVVPSDAEQWLIDSILKGGGVISSPERAEAVVWFGRNSPDDLAQVLDRSPQVAWVQIPVAGVEMYSSMFGDNRIWTSAKGAFAKPTAEHALALLLAQFRQIVRFARSTSWESKSGRTLYGAHITIVGGGGVARSLVKLLESFDCDITVVRRESTEFDSNVRVVTQRRLANALMKADAVVLALALTPKTEGLIGQREFEQMKPDACLVNVSRGRLVRTDDLVWALSHGEIGSAALDVTDPEPLPPEHPLWREQRCIISPHTATTPDMHEPMYAVRVSENVRRFREGRDLVGLIDADLGY
jgi:phosphoglycerate dehydrogenase-like enzyme